MTHYLPNLTQEYKVTGLTALTTYTIQVAAMTSKGQGQLSASTISSGVPPGQMQYLTLIWVHAGVFEGATERTRFLKLVLVCTETQQNSTQLFLRAGITRELISFSLLSILFCRVAWSSDQFSHLQHRPSLRHAAVQTWLRWQDVHFPLADWSPGKTLYLLQHNEDSSCFFLVLVHIPVDLFNFLRCSYCPLSRCISDRYNRREWRVAVGSSAV